jgi:Ca-activated chloride channel homolog
VLFTTFRNAGTRARHRDGSVLAGCSQLLACGLILAGFSAAQSSSVPAAAPTPTSTQTPSTAPTQSAPIQNAPAQSAPAQTTPDQTPTQDDDNGFVFKKEVEEVVLHATVVDDQNHLITGLDRGNFQVYEDGKPQELTSFREERVPVTLGILIDNSGSMLPKRAKVSEAALRLVDASQQEDRVFVVNFGEDAFLDQDYTQDVDKLRAALQRVQTQGSTALYDAIIAAVNHLNQTSSNQTSSSQISSVQASSNQAFSNPASATQRPVQKEVLLVVTDGRDNASQATFQEVLRKLQSKNGPVLYTIALEPNDRRDAGSRQSLQMLSEQTGGTAFFPSSLDEVQSIASAIARDIRSQYVIGYRSSNPHTAGVYHTIRVQAAGGSAPLRVSTRPGYYSGGQ